MRCGHTIKHLFRCSWIATLLAVAPSRMGPGNHLDVLKPMEPPQSITDVFEKGLPNGHRKPLIEDQGQREAVVLIWMPDRS